VRPPLALDVILDSFARLVDKTKNDSAHGPMPCLPHMDPMPWFLIYRIARFVPGTLPRPRSCTGGRCCWSLHAPPRCATTHTYSIATSACQRQGRFLRGLQKRTLSIHGSGTTRICLLEEALDLVAFSTDAYRYMGKEVHDLDRRLHGKSDS